MPQLGDIDQIKTDSGRYQGLADNNFFEVKISGVPEDKESRVFMITDTIRSKSEDLNLQKDDVVKIKYIKNESGQLVVLDIERI